MNKKLIEISTKISNKGKLKILMDANRLISSLDKINSAKDLKERLSDIFMNEYFEVKITNNVYEETIINHLGKWDKNMDDYFEEFFSNNKDIIIEDFSKWSNIRKKGIPKNLDLKNITDLTIITGCMDANIPCMVSKDKDFDIKMVNVARKFSGYTKLFYIIKNNEWKKEVNKIYTIINFLNSINFSSVIKSDPDFTNKDFEIINNIIKKSSLESIVGYLDFVEKETEILDLKRVNWEMKVKRAEYEDVTKSFILLIDFEYYIENKGFRDLAHLDEITLSEFKNLITFKDGYKQINTFDKKILNPVLTNIVNGVKKYRSEHGEIIEWKKEA